MRSLKRELLEILKQKKNRKKVALFKNKDELLFLKEWILKEENNEPEKKKEKFEEKATGITKTNLSIFQKIDVCNKCEPIRLRKKPFGSGKNSIFVLLNAPRLANIDEINFYKNESVELLKKMFASIKIDMSECYITNLIKCETKSMLLKPSEMVARCIPFLEEELTVLSPKIVVVFGDIFPVQKIVHNSSYDWYNLDHPVTLIKNPDLKRKAWNTLKLVKEKLDSTF